MSRPVVGVDLRYVAGSSRGYRRMMNLYRELDRIDSEFRFEWITDASPIREDSPSERTRWVPSSRRLRFLHRPFLGHLRSTIWPCPDILHFPTADCWSVPSCRTVVTLHDLAPFHFPEWFFSGKQEETRYLDHLKTIFRVSDAVITVSRFSRGDLLRQFPDSASKIHLVYQGVDPVFGLEEWEPSQVESFRFNVGAPRGYLLYCGGIDARKNLEFLLEVFSRLVERSDFTKHLIIVGDVDSPRRGMADLRDRVREKNLGNRVIFPGWVSDALLRRFYNAADLFLFPSRMEGFGYAPLEAMACGCPVLCSDASVMPETVDDAAVLLPGDDIGAWTEAIRRTLSSPQEREKLRRKGFEQVRRFDWNRTAQATLEVYRSILPVNSG